MNAAVGRIYTNEACAVYLDVSTPQGSELPLDVSGQLTESCAAPGPAFHLDMSRKQEQVRLLTCHHNRILS
jgi:hypothetical protein